MTDLALLELERKKINAKLTRMRIFAASAGLLLCGIYYNLTGNLFESALLGIGIFFALLGFFKNMLT